MPLKLIMCQPLQQSVTLRELLPHAGNCCIYNVNRDFVLWGSPSGDVVSLAVTVLGDDIIPFPESHLIYTMEGALTYIRADFSYTCAAAAASGTGRRMSVNHRRGKLWKGSAQRNIGRKELQIICSVVPTYTHIMYYFYFKVNIRLRKSSICSVVMM